MSVLDRSDLEASPLADLHVIATELGLDGFRRLRKAELIDAIVERQGGEAAAPADAEPEGEASGDDAEPEPDADAETDDQPEAERPRRRRRGGRGRGRRSAERESEEDGEPDTAGDSGREEESRDRVVEGAVELLG